MDQYWKKCIESLDSIKKLIINMNTELKKNAKNDFEKDFFKYGQCRF